MRRAIRVTFWALLLGLIAFAARFAIESRGSFFDRPVKPTISDQLRNYGRPISAEMEKLLDQRLPADFKLPSEFKPAIEALAAQTKARVVLYSKVLESEGVDRATRVNANVAGLKLTAAIDKVLADVSPAGHPLRYVVVGEVIEVSTKSAFDRGNVSSRVFDVRDLLTFDDPAADARAYADLHHALLTTIDPASWKVGSGGAPRIQIVGDNLIVVQNVENTVRIEHFLAEHRWRRKLTAAAGRSWLTGAAAGAGALIVLLSISVFRASRRRASGHCVICGYDLRATPDRCPECGTRVSGRFVALDTAPRTPETTT